MSHADARLTVHGRAELVRRILEQGGPVAHVVGELNVSRATGYKWLARWRAEGSAGLLDRSSRAHRLTRKTPAELEQRVLNLRSTRTLGPARQQGDGRGRVPRKSLVDRAPARVQR